MAGRADERVALLVLLVSGLLPDQGQAGVRAPLTENGRSRPPVEVTSRAGRGFLGQFLKRGHVCRSYPAGSALSIEGRRLHQGRSPAWPHRARGAPGRRARGTTGLTRGPGLGQRIEKASAPPRQATPITIQLWPFSSRT